ncbi:tyrosine-type recombinase/integrase [Candidatus Stoquefichus massiliensis]|uniref:tyrosine-type recombinase/integrase n=1 Tax=Candidatus Stoquefichus massiliensis TaxID=1470350 RepID=UPI00048868C3|nr:site-specific integrase [Candidatus Stoquefichus massiliensis]
MNKKCISEVAGEWLELKKLSVKYSTFVKYEVVVNNHINPYFKDCTIEQMNDEIILNFFHMLFNENKYANSTLMTIKYVLKSINRYIQIKYGTINNSMDLIKIVKKVNEVTTLTNYQKSHLSNYCFNHYKPIHMAVLIALYGGLRIGEICALKWENINYEEGFIIINKTIERLKSKDTAQKKTTLMVLNPKTSSSKRIVPIPLFLLEYIKEYQQYITIKNVEDYILTNSNRIPEPRTTQYRFAKLCNQFGFSIKFHSLRHSYATNCVMQEIDTKSLSEILGHSSVGTTLNLYVHSSLDFKKKQVNKIIKF